MSNEKAIEFLWQHIASIRATLTSCVECNGDRVTPCPICQNALHCNQCGGGILLDGTCENCDLGKPVTTCDGCDHLKNGQPTCPKCEGKGYEIEFLQLDGKQATTVDALYRKFEVTL